MQLTLDTLAVSEDFLALFLGGCLGLPSADFLLIVAVLLPTFTISAHVFLTGCFLPVERLEKITGWSYYIYL